MGLIGNLVSGAKGMIDEHREEAKAAAEQKSREQDAGWPYQLRLRREFTGSWNSARSEVIYVSDRAGNSLYKVEAGLLSPKRRTLIKDMSKTKIATLKAVRFKGIGVEAAIDVSFGDSNVGRVLKRKAGMMNGFDYGYHFEPLGIRLDMVGGFKDFRYEIKNASNTVIAMVYYCNRYEDDWYKINYSNPDMGLYFLAMLLAKGEIDHKEWED